MAAGKSRLGRGLGALISGGAAPVPGGAPAAPPPSFPVHPAVATPPAPGPAAAHGFQEIPVQLVDPSPYQPRREIHSAPLGELVESIRAEGLLQPVVVRRAGDGRYQLIAGERRWRAFQQLKLKTIPARVIEATDASSATLTLIENLQREGLNPIEEAYGYASLIRDFDLTQEQAAERVGRSRPTVANALRLLTLDGEIQGYLAKELLSVGHAKVLLGVESVEQRTLLARRVLEQGLSVRALEDVVQSGRGIRARRRGVRAVPEAEAAAVADIEKRLTSHLGARVSLRHSLKRGRIIIAYAGNDDLQRILQKLGLEG
ncbi:MAG: chromosome partitioning protein ParB [Verrucomicrobia bacterium RIFCSPLOWO2_12_FULL_64_8]|nr:MAG: chromosome partitioning protein ParB [Verrucomicrobia bacterium RIFCSPLOWO2_12_FULL_64_8]